MSPKAETGVSARMAGANVSAYNRRVTEIVRVSRLSAAVLVTWLAFLGAVLPACTCAAAAPVQNCCPDVPPDQCTGGDPPRWARADAACPNLSPAAMQSVPVLPGRAAPERQTDFGSPDCAVLSARVIAQAASAARRERRFVTASVADRDDSSTYLRTLRLRL